MDTSASDPFGAIREFEHGGTTYRMADLTVLEEQGLCDLDTLPVSIRILLESVLRNVDGEAVTEAAVRNVASWAPDVPDVELPFTPSRVVPPGTGIVHQVNLEYLGRVVHDRARGRLDRRGPRDGTGWHPRGGRVRRTRGHPPRGPQAPPHRGVGRRVPPPRSLPRPSDRRSTVTDWIRRSSGIECGATTARPPGRSRRGTGLPGRVAASEAGRRLRPVPTGAPDVDERRGPRDADQHGRREARRPQVSNPSVSRPLPPIADP